MLSDMVMYSVGQNLFGIPSKSLWKNLRNFLFNLICYFLKQEKRFWEANSLQNGSRLHPPNLYILTFLRFDAFESLFMMFILKLQKDTQKTVRRRETRIPTLTELCTCPSLPMEIQPTEGRNWFSSMLDFFHGTSPSISKLQRNS